MRWRPGGPGHWTRRRDSVATEKTLLVRRRPIWRLVFAMVLAVVGFGGLTVYTAVQAHRVGKIEGIVCDNQSVVPAKDPVLDSAAAARLAKLCGDRGPTGAPGAPARSIRGPQGLQGPPGPSGRPGRTGASGPAGRDGRPGRSGRPGETGRRGRRGHGMTQAQVMRAVASQIDGALRRNCGGSCKGRVGTGGVPGISPDLPDITTPGEFQKAVDQALCAVLPKLPLCSRGP